MGKEYDANALLIGALLFSAVAHLGTWFALEWVDVEQFTRLISEVEFAVVEEEPEPELVEIPDEEEIPEEEDEPEPEPEPEPRRPPPEPEDVEEEPEPPAPAEETPVAFDNIVLTNDSGNSGWATHQGSGVDREGPVGRPRAEVTGRSRMGEPGGQVGGTGQAGPAVVPMSSLTRRPAPPSDLDSMLQRFYPREARRQGVEGRSQIRIRINPDGSVRVLRTVASTGQEFAQACTRMLRQTRWRPALGPEGDPAATVTNFSCDFTVSY